MHTIAVIENYVSKLKREPGYKNTSSIVALRRLTAAIRRAESECELPEDHPFRKFKLMTVPKRSMFAL